MSRSSAPVLVPARLLLSLLPLLLIDASSAQTVLDIGCRVKICTALDVALLQEYVTGLRQLNDTDQRPDELSADEQRLLPFGALASDWERLMLLQNSQPEGTALRDNLLRLSRLVLAAYFHSQDVKVAGEEKIGESLDSSAVPELEDQQATSAIPGSTARIDASPSHRSDTGEDNNGEESADSWEDSTTTTTAAATTSYYAESTSANFNQAFSTLVSPDNEASGSKSNETLPGAAAVDNEDESTTETFFQSRGAPSSPESNEAVHPRSEEDFLVSRYASKEARRGDDELVARFFAEERDSNVSNGSMEDLLALMELEEAEQLANSSTSESPPPPSADSFEFNATGSLEALLDAMERLNESSTASPDDPELTSSQELLELIDGLSAEDNPTTRLVQIISGQLSAETPTYSNEASADTTENGRTDRSEEDTDTALPSLSPTTDKASSENHTRELEARGSAETTVDAVPADWASTLAIDDTTSSYQVESEPRRPGKILTIFRHSEAAGASSNKLRETAKESEQSPWPTEESASFNPTSSENRMDRQPEIAGMNKRKRGGEPLL